MLFMTGTRSLDILGSSAPKLRHAPDVRHSRDTGTERVSEWKYPSVFENAPQLSGLSDTLSALANPQPVENSYFGLSRLNKTDLVLLTSLYGLVCFLQATSKWVLHRGEGGQSSPYLSTFS